MKNLLKSILFIIILFVILTILSILVLKNTEINVKSQIGIIGEKENSIDYVVVGDSETYSAINPLAIYREYGYTGYVRGTVAQKTFKSYNMAKEALRNQKIKIVFMETNAVFRKYKWSLAISGEIESIFPIIEYHDRWKTLIDENKIKDWSDPNKGYKYSKKIKSATNNKYMVSNKAIKDIPDKNIFYIEKIINLCNKNDIKFVFVSTPSSKNWNYSKHNAIAKFAKENNVDYLDLNLDKEINIDWKTDTRDKGDHLNYSGAIKTSNAIGKYIKSLNLLEDHRNDENYSEWNNLKENYDPKDESSK